MLTLRDMRKTFNPGTELEVRALQGVSLDIDDGSFIVVVGMNGSGKSTLLSAIAGEFRLDQGSITINGRDVTRLPVHRRASMIGRVFQDPFAGTAPALTVAENLAIASRRGRFRGFGRALPRAFREELRERVADFGMGLEHRLDTPIGSLSGGQRQALTLLMAAWRKPDILLLDEHTAALDPRSAEIVARISARIIAEHGLTALMVTHSLQQATSLGDRLIVMHAGSVALDVRGNAKHAERAHTLLARFDDLRREDALTADAARLLQDTYA